MRSTDAISKIVRLRCRGEFRRSRLLQQERTVRIERRIRRSFATADHFDRQITRLGFVRIRRDQRSGTDDVRAGIAGDINRALENTRSAQRQLHIVARTGRRPGDREVLHARSRHVWNLKRKRGRQRPFAHRRVVLRVALQIDNEFGIFGGRRHVRLIRARALSFHFDLFVIRNHEDLVPARQIHVGVAVRSAHLQRGNHRRRRVRRRIRRNRCGNAPRFDVFRIHRFDRAGIQQQKTEAQG